MHVPSPLVLRLPHAHLRAHGSIPALLARTQRASGTQLRALQSRFDVTPDEKTFAKTLLSARKNLWLFRTHQAGYCGDFVVVDMSAPEPKQRNAWVCDLKRGAKLRFGGGGAGIQLLHAPRAIDAVATGTGALEVGGEFERVVGDRSLLLEFFGVSFATLNPSRRPLA